MESRKHIKGMQDKKHKMCISDMFNRDLGVVRHELYCTVIFSPQKLVNI